MRPIREKGNQVPRARLRGRRPLRRGLAVARLNPSERRRMPRVPCMSGRLVLIAAHVGLMAGAGCGRTAPAPADERVAVTRTVGSWQGRGNSTIGVNSDTGRFHIAWQARNAEPA